MSALSLAHPWFLLGLTALSVPIILHLMHREVPRRVVFPTLRFIMKGHRFQTGRRGLRDLLTLLVRLLLLTLTVLLFADPIMRRPPTGTGRDRQETVIYIDLSASLSAVDFAAFVTAAVAELTARPNNVLGLVAADARVRTVLPLGTPPAAVREAVAQLAPSRYAGEHDDALVRAGALFSSAPGVRRRLVLLTDAQAADWAIGKLPVLARDVMVSVISPPDLPTANLAIERVAAQLFVRRDSRRLRATVQVRNHGLTAATARLTVRTGRNSVAREIDVRPGDSDKCILDLENPVGHAAVAVLEGDAAYHLDDTYHFWFGPRPPVIAAVIADSGPDRDQAVESFFLHQALSTAAPGAEPYDVRMTAPATLEMADLADVDCVFLLDSAHAMSDSGLTRLRNFLTGGGVVFYFSGMRSADSLGRLSAAGIGTVRFLGFRGDRGQRRMFTVERMNEESPVLAAFLPDHSDLLHFPLYFVARLHAAAATPLLALDAETPLLLQETVDNGTLYVFAVGLDPSWSDLPTSLSFVPLVREAVSHAVGPRDRGLTRLVLHEDSEAALMAAGVPAPMASDASPGVYMVGGRAIELNVTRAESGLRRVAAYDIVERLSPLTADRAASAPVAAGQPAPGRSLRPHLAWLLLALLVAELLAANLRPRRRRA